MSPEELGTFRSRGHLNETYNGNEPAVEGLFDQRIGVLDQGKNVRLMVKIVVFVPDILVILNYTLSSIINI